MVRLGRNVVLARNLTDALYDNRRLGITGLIQVNALLGQLLNTAVTRGYVKVDINLVLTAPRGY